MSQTLSTSRGPDTSALQQHGPVFAAIKPRHGSRAVLDVARWLSAREERELEVLSVSARDEANAGSAARVIVDAAHERDARVIVIGTGGDGTEGRHVFGEGALQILTLADRPVLIVPADAAAGAVSVAVVAVDFSPCSLQAARAVLPMLAERGHLHLVHVEPVDALRLETLSARALRYGESFNRFRRQLSCLPGVTVETASLCGEPADMLARYARTHSAGLIACGRLGLSYVQRLFVRSLSADLASSAPCPVLVVPETHPA